MVNKIETTAPIVCFFHKTVVTYIYIFKNLNTTNFYLAIQD